MNHLKILLKANEKAAKHINYSEALKLLVLLKYQNNDIVIH